MHDLTTGNEAKLIWNFTIPMLIGNVFQQSTTVVDSVIVGRIIGKSALAAVGASFPIMFLLISLIIGIMMGFSILISQYFGAKDMEKVKQTIDTNFIFLFLSSLGVTVIGILLSKSILILLKTTPETLPQAIIFLQITFGGMLFLFGYVSISAILRGLGDSKTPLYFVMITTVLNAVLVILFVMVFKWGIAGSAFATVIAQAVTFVLGITYLNRTHEVLKFRFIGLSFDMTIFKKSLSIGLPSGIQQMLVATGMMALTRIVNGFGTDAMAAFTVAGRLDSFAMMPAMNLSAAISSFVGQNMGAGKMERVKHGLRASLVIAAVISVVISLTVIIFNRELIACFNADAMVIMIGSRYLLIIGGFYIIFSSMFVINGALRGAGDTFVPMLFTILSLWIIRIPLSGWLSVRIGTDGIWWGVPIAWSVGLILSFGYFISGRWKTKGIVKPPLVRNMKDGGV